MKDSERVFSINAATPPSLTLTSPAPTALFPLQATKTFFLIPSLCTPISSKLIGLSNASRAGVANPAPTSLPAIPIASRMGMLPPDESCLSKAGRGIGCVSAGDALPLEEERERLREVLLLADADAVGAAGEGRFF